MKKILLNPFKQVQTNRLLSFGIIFGILSCLLQLFTHFRVIAILKMVPLKSASNFGLNLIDYTVSTLVLSLGLFIYGRIIYKGTRFIDILNTVLIARLVFIFSLALDIKGWFSNFSLLMIKNINNPSFFMDHSLDLALFSIAGFAMLLFVIVFFYYMFKGFQVATNSKKISHMIILFLLILILDTITQFISTLY